MTRIALFAILTLIPAPHVTGCFRVSIHPLPRVLAPVVHAPVRR